MTDEIMEMLNNHEGARKLRAEFEDHIKESDLSNAEIEEERKTMIMLAMTMVPETIEMMGQEVYHKINN